MANETTCKSRLHLENGIHTKGSENVTPVCGGLHGPVVLVRPEDLTFCKDPLGLEFFSFIYWGAFMSGPWGLALPDKQFTRGLHTGNTLHPGPYPTHSLSGFFFHIVGLCLCVHLRVMSSVDLTVHSCRLCLDVGLTLPHIGLATYLNQ
jgi:hypothetical protein